MFAPTVFPPRPPETAPKLPCLKHALPKRRRLERPVLGSAQGRWAGEWSLASPVLVLESNTEESYGNKRCRAPHAIGDLWERGFLFNLFRELPVGTH